MLMGLRQQLMASAVARHLAVDLLQIHGDKAGEALKEMLRESSSDAARCEILRKAGDVLESLQRKATRPGPEQENFRGDIVN